MNRQKYFDFIESKLSLLVSRIELRGGLNLLDLHLHSENFYLHFFNLIFGLNLQNLNTLHQNAEGVDLIDAANKIIIQVSATATKQKVEATLNKNLSKYMGYAFKFISISKNANNLRTKSFKNPHKLIFNQKCDIFDVTSLLKLISAMDIGKLKTVYDFLKLELKDEPDPEKVESNLTKIIGVLSKTNWAKEYSVFETIPYEVEDKISYNKLVTARDLIDDYKIHYHRIDKIYLDFDKQAQNRSLSILEGIRAEYHSIKTITSPDECFFTVIDKVTKKIKASSNYVQMPDEELKLCVTILVVDAFIRCKIFKNPMRDI